MSVDVTNLMAELPLHKVNEIWTEKGFWLSDAISIATIGENGMKARIYQQEMVSEICRHTTGFTPKVAKIGCVTYDMWDVFCEKVQAQFAPIQKDRQVMRT